MTCFSIPSTRLFLADLGGMGYGFLCGLSTINRLSSDFFGLEESWRSQARHFVVRFFGLILSLFSVAITFIILMQGDGRTNPCPTCTWLSCVPFPPWEGPNSKWWYCDDCVRVSADIVSQPFLHLDLSCPSGAIAQVNITREEMDRNSLEHKLPTFCRNYCHALDEAEAGADDLN
jgi:hypothetical protein